MIEAYAFLTAFPLQVLTMSVLLPALFVHRLRKQVASFPAERLAQVYPGIDHVQKLDRYLRAFRLAAATVALAGALLLAWMVGRVGSPEGLHDAANYARFYFLLQALPVMAHALVEIRLKNEIIQRSTPEAKRRASLHRRGLFDFVSPISVSLAGLAYVFFVGYVFYLREHPFPGFAGLVNIAGVSVLYAGNALAVCWLLYGKKINAFETRADSLRTIGIGVRALVYSAIAGVTFLSLDFTLKVLELRSWEAFATSVFFIATALLSVGAFSAPLRRTEAAG